MAVELIRSDPERDGVIDPDADEIWDSKAEFKSSKPLIQRIRNRRSSDLEMPLSLFKRLALCVFGQVYIGNRTRSGWSGSLPFYAFNCPLHGVVVDYPHGYENRLDCPKCRGERDLMGRLEGIE